MYSFLFIVNIINMKLDIIKEFYDLKKTMPDLMIKRIKCGLFKYVYIISMETVSATDKINDFILKYFMQRSIFKTLSNLKKDIKDFIPSINYKEVKESDAINLVLNGFTLVIYNNEILSFETRSELDRGITESSSLPVVRGPKDAFCENYQKNLGLIRKRVKSKYLQVDEMDIGTLSKNRLGIIYLSNIVDDSLINSVKNKLKLVKIDNIVDSNDLKDYLDSENHTFFPTLLYTEKPDDTSRFLLEGRVAILIENSPSLIIIPTLFVDFFHASEDYYHKPFFASFMRFIRLIAFFLSITLPAIFISVLNYDPEILPVSLLINFAEQRNSVPFPLIIEAFILMFTFELLYEGDSRTPTTRGASLSVLGALVLGDAAVSAGIISPIMVIVVSISAISSLIFIYYDIQGVIRFYRYFLMIISSLFGIIGLIIGLQFLLIDISSIDSFGKPYTLPTSPFLKGQIGNSFIKSSIKKLKRPSFLKKGSDS